MFTNFNIDKISLRKSIVRVSLALILALTILVVSMQISIKMAQEKLEEDVENEAEQKSAVANVIANAIFMANDWVINSFLTGISNIESETDSVSNELFYRHIIDDDYLNTLNINDIYEQLRSFISYNVEFYSAIMIFEKGAIKSVPDGIAAAVYSDNTTNYNLLADYQLFKNDFYNQVKESGKSIVRSGIIKKNDVLVFTNAVPLYNERGVVIGEFWVDVEAKYFSKMLNMYKSDDAAAAIIISDDCVVISSTNTNNNGKSLKDVSMKICGGQFPQEWYSEVQARVLQEKYSYFENKFVGEPIVTYIFPIKNTKYNLMVIKHENELYGDVTKFVLTSFIIMIVSVLLISACLIYIFYVFKKKYDENNRMEGEFGMAAEIQRGILPLNTQYIDNQFFDIYGFQRPAKSVGGDLYDFMLKGDSLHFCIGDVSGKGMPAALVMTELCSLYRYIICYHSDPQEIVSLINKAVMERSDDSMFCTLFVGVLNLKTGMLEFCNAGHNPPIFISKDDSHVNYLKIKPNMPIYAFENFKYVKESLQLNRGDRLFVYTDGVTEAKNENNEFYGNEATLKTIQKLKNQPFNDLVNGVLKDLKSFTKKAEQHDDITILCVEYKGANDCVSLHYDNVKANVTKIVDDVLAACELADDMKLRLAVEEPVQNIADYAYETDGAVDIEILKNTDNQILEITLIDNGKPFNPLESIEPDISVPIEERQVGGLGIFLTRKMMEDVSYQFANQQNRLKLKYKIK